MPHSIVTVVRRLVFLLHTSLQGLEVRTSHNASECTCIHKCSYDTCELIAQNTALSGVYFKREAFFCEWGWEELGTEPKTSHMPEKCPVTEQHSQPRNHIFMVLIAFLILDII